jgi:hypothetical protein
MPHGRSGAARGPSPRSTSTYAHNFHGRTSLVLVKVRWIPGHTDIPGNEEADKLAKAGAKMPTGPSKPTLTWQKGEFSRMLIREKQEWWATNAPKSYKALEINMPTGKPKELELPRWALGRLVSARSRHGDFVEYYERFQHERYIVKCACGRDKTPRTLLPLHPS